MRSFTATPCRGLAGLAVEVLALLTSHAHVAAAEPIVVALIDGSVVSGEVDDQTDAERLWLRREEAGIELCSGIAWSQVQAVHRGQNELIGHELRIDYRQN